MPKSLRNRWCLGLLAVVMSIQAFAAEPDVAQQLRDRDEIEALMWRYVRALDTLDAEAYASVYTPDGRFGAGPNATVGREALKQMVVGLKANQAERAAAGTASPPMYHVITNDYLEFVSADEARYHSYWMTMFGPAEQGGQPRVAAVGRGIDELVKVDGRWLIKARNVAPQD
jgi:uncharacterized protein (TIGR02246 family)